MVEEGTEKSMTTSQPASALTALSVSVMPSSISCPICGCPLRSRAAATIKSGVWATAARTITPMRPSAPTTTTRLRSWLSDAMPGATAVTITEAPAL